MPHRRIADVGIRVGGQGGFLLLVALAWACLAPPAAPGSEARERLPEYEVKAAFLYNFTRFIEWPEHAFDGPDAPFRIGILGEDPFGEALDKVIAGRRIDGRPLEVLRSDRFEDLIGVQMLYLDEAGSRRIREYRARLAGRPILTVSDTEMFAERGGMIELYLRDRRVAFRINRDSAEKSGMHISSRLLRLATIVEEGRGE